MRSLSIASLSDASIHVTSMRNKTGRLEELFFTLTENKSAANPGEQA